MISKESLEILKELAETQDCSIHWNSEYNIALDEAIIELEDIKEKSTECEYCKKIINNKKIKDIDKDKEEWLEIIYQPLHKFMIYVELNGTDNDGYKTVDFFKINYCPMCGRKLV